MSRRPPQSSPAGTRTGCHHDGLKGWLANVCPGNGGEASSGRDAPQGSVRWPAWSVSAEAQNRRGGRFDERPIRTTRLAFNKRPPPPHSHEGEDKRPRTAPLVFGAGPGRKKWKEMMTRGDVARGNEQPRAYSIFCPVFFQSARKVARPLSVRGCLNRVRINEGGIVATSAPIMATSLTLSGVRIDAARISVFSFG